LRLVVRSPALLQPTKAQATLITSDVSARTFAQVLWDTHHL